MKRKILAMLLSLVSIFALFACDLSLENSSQSGKSKADSSLGSVIGEENASSKDSISSETPTVEDSVESSVDDNSEDSSSAGYDEPFDGIYTVTAGYAYGLNEDGRAELLFGGSSQFFDLPSDEKVVAGDVFTVYYTGELTIAEIYPSHVYIEGGGVESVEMQKAKIVRLSYTSSYNGAGERFEIEHDNGTVEEIKVAARPDYYVDFFGKEVRYESLSESYSQTLFGTYSPVDGYDEEKGYRFSGLYLWNPRFEKRDVHPDTLATVEELNENSGFEFNLLQTLENCDFSGWEYNPGFGCESYQKDGVEYEFSTYPDCASGEYCITAVTCAYGKWSLFGLNGDETDEEIIQTLAAHGYTVETGEGMVSNTIVSVNRYGVNIRFENKDGKWEIRVGLKTTNDTGVIY